MNVLKWASYDSDFKPNTLDMRFRLWAKKGITAYCTFTDQGQLLDFNSLKEQFHLDSKDFFRYLQLRQHFDWWRSKEVKIFSSAYKAEPMLKTNTKLALMDLQGDSYLYIKERWVVLPSQLRTGKIYVNHNVQLLVLLIGEDFAGEITIVFSLHQNRKINS